MTSHEAHHIPKQRMHHAATIYGNILFIHGGMNTDDKYIYDDYFFYDIQAFEWKEINYENNIISKIGARRQHTIGKKSFKKYRLLRLFALVYI